MLYIYAFNNHKRTTLKSKFNRWHLYSSTENDMRGINNLSRQTSNPSNFCTLSISSVQFNFFFFYKYRQVTLLLSPSFTLEISSKLFQPFDSYKFQLNNEIIKAALTSRYFKNIGSYHCSKLNHSKINQFTLALITSIYHY